MSTYDGIMISVVSWFILDVLMSIMIDDRDTFPVVIGKLVDDYFPSMHE